MSRARTTTTAELRHHRLDLIARRLEDPVEKIRDRLAYVDFDIFFLTGIGEVFPFIRSHNVLNNLQSVVTGKPMLMFFPGRYEQSDTLGSSLVLFGRLKDDQYYRAKNILEQEA